MVHGDSKCFTKGSSQPKINPDGITLFSMRFCPYAQRARIALRAKNIPHDIVNVDLKDKPEWFLQRNPMGKVPTVEEPGNKVTFESLVVAEYLDEAYPSTPKLLPEDPYMKAQQKMLIEIISQKFFANLQAAFLKDEQEHVDNVLKGLDEVEKLLKEQFFAGKEVGYVDLMVWPWLQRLPSLKAIRNVDISDARYPKINNWIKKMYELPYIKETTYPDDVMTQFVQSIRDGKVNYDAGL